MKHSIDTTVISQEMLSDGIYSLVLHAPAIASEAGAGQFIGLYSRDQSRLLMRPISLCGIDAAAGTLRLVYRVTGAGTGTEEFSLCRPGDTLRAIGPLGNGFPLDKAEGKRVILIGGGIGIPPLLEAGKRLSERPAAVLGYRDALFLDKEFEDLCDTCIATESGSAGTKGTVLDAIREQGVTGDMIFACGPMPMLRAVKVYALEKGMPAYLSLEERMACGIGACLGCVCRTAQEDPHSHVHNARVCQDGPVFECREVEL